MSITSSAEIKNGQGIHVRPSGVIVSETAGLNCKISLESKGMEIELLSIMDLLALGLQCGETVGITVDGNDEEKILPVIVELFEREYDFPPRE